MRKVVVFPLFLKAFFASLLVVWVASPSVAFAQADPVLDEIEEGTQQQQRSTQDIEKTAGESQKLISGDENGLVTFADVLADPDNTDLNFRFARQQVQSNDLKGAATSLERILHP